MTNRFLHHVRLIFTRRDVLALLVVVGLAGVVVAAFAIQDSAAPAPIAVAGGDGTGVPVAGGPSGDMPFGDVCTEYRVDEAREHVVHLDNAGSAKGEQGVVGHYRLASSAVEESGILVGLGDGRCLQDAFPCAWTGGPSDYGRMAAIFGFLTPDDEVDRGTHGSRWTFDVRSYAKTTDGTVWISSLQGSVVVYANDNHGTYEPAYYCDIEAVGLV
jgi:hypothetical protein